jgi:chorismate lyase
MDCQVRTDRDGMAPGCLQFLDGVAPVELRCVAQTFQGTRLCEQGKMRFKPAADPEDVRERSSGSILNKATLIRGRWRSSAAVGDRVLRSWIGERGSLTKRLRAGCGRLSLRLVRQRLAVPLRDEAALLGLRGGQRAWVREVLLLADGAPVVFAHSVARVEALRVAWRSISRVGLRPVGDAIFERHGMRRGPIQARRVNAFDRLHRSAASALAGTTKALVRPLPVLWARRSPFVRAGQALWITEVFLPGIARIGSRRPD